MNFFHSGAGGDVIYALPTIKAILDKPGNYWGKLYLGPTVNLEALLPLLRSQPFLNLNTVDAHAGEPIDVNLDDFRNLPIDYAKGSLMRFFAWAHGVGPDFSKGWIDVPGDKNDLIIVNRTARYKNPGIDYHFLAGRKDAVFIGHPQEHEAFQNEQGLFIPYFPTADFLEAACLIKGCRLFIGNQSCCYAVAEAIKAPRLLEVCLHAPNVVPTGMRGYDAIIQPHFESLFRELASRA